MFGSLVVRYSSSSLYVIILTFISADTGMSGVAGLRLVSVHVAIRHGDRSPLHSVPNVVNKPFNCRLNPSHSHKNSNLTEFLRRMEEMGHGRDGNSSYAGYSLYPAADDCGLGSLTQIGVEQHILIGAFLRQAYVTRHNLFGSGNESFGEQVS